ncbi:hypothetical protein HDV02_004145 [Globomyces sp. JEL0801]|nr:hypothetical protein HDV02_004145 [Globomyces sp. JEL0801]
MFTEYQTLRLSSKYIQLQIPASLTWESYHISTQCFTYPNQIQIYFKPLWNSINPQRLEYLYNDHQFDSILKFLKSNLLDIPLIIMNELLLRSCIDGKSDLLEIILKRSDIDPSIPDDYNRRRKSNQHISLSLAEYLSVDRLPDDCNEPICYATLNGHVECVRLLLGDSRLKKKNLSDTIWCASASGHEECLKVLLGCNLINPQGDFNENYGLFMSVEKSKPECLKILLSDSRLDPSIEDNYLVRLASEKGDWQCLEILLQDSRVDPGVDSNISICVAAEKGYTKCLELLLKDGRVDPSTGTNYPIRSATYNRHVECVRLLMDDPRVNPTIFNNSLLTFAKESGIDQLYQIFVSRVQVDDDIDPIITYSSPL